MSKADANSHQVRVQWAEASRYASATSWAVQCWAALGCDAAVLRSAVGASPKVRAVGDGI
jgi:hypothetical protein